MTEVANIVPYTAWEQAVFVALFILVVLILLNWFSKQQKSWQEYMNTQNEKWQAAIDALNDQWRIWIAEQDKRVCESMKGVTEALNRLNDKLESHDNKVEIRLRDAVEEIKPTRTRKRKPTESQQ